MVHIHPNILIIYFEAVINLKWFVVNEEKLYYSFNTELCKFYISGKCSVPYLPVNCVCSVVLEKTTHYPNDIFKINLRVKILFRIHMAPSYSCFEIIIMFNLRLSFLSFI